MAIPENIIDQVQTRTDIVEVISRYVPLKKAGTNFKAPCPFHEEKTPSFMVSSSKQIYHCFGCGAGGNVFSFLMRHENLTFPEAVETLAERAGIALPRFSREKEEYATLAKSLYHVNELAAEFFQATLSASPQAREYLKSRGIGDEMARMLKVGYAPDAWDGLLGFFKKKNVPEDLLLKAGLIIANDRGGYYDRFRKRVTFPIADVRDKILGFGGRVLDASLPKYMNSPETPIYSKGRNLFGLNVSKDFIKKANHALVVEGYLDYIVPFQAGVRNIIATLGTALTIDQVKLLKRFTNTVVMVYDPDEAGEAATVRNLDIFINEDVSVYIAELPQGYDPDGYIRKFGAEEFKKLVKAGKNLFDYKLAVLGTRYDMRSPGGKAAIAAEMLPTLNKIGNAVMKSELIKRLAQRLSVDEESLKTELKKVKPDNDYTGYKQMIVPGNVKRGGRAAEKMVLAILLEGGALIGKAQETLSLDEVKDSSVRDLVKAIFDLHRTDAKVSPAQLISHLQDREEATLLISEAVNIAEIIEDKERALFDCIAWIKKSHIKEQLDGLQAQIKTAHEASNEDAVQRLVVEYNNLIKEQKV